jgi:thioredoxin-like negative regulator of GroEL
LKNITTKQEFEAEIGGGKGKAVLFYSAYCPFCQSFLPEFEACAAKKPGVLAKVCTDDLTELEDTFAVEVVPSVLYFKGGKLTRRLDGVLGVGLTEKKLAEFLQACGA